MSSSQPNAQNDSAPDIIAAHRHCSMHADEIRRSELCGCFYCVSTYPAAEITDWVDQLPDGTAISDSGHTALCPRCGIDSVIGSASGYPVTQEFLSRMKAHWF